MIIDQVAFGAKTKIACIARVFVGLGSKERPRNGTGTVFCPREIGARANPTETLTTQAKTKMILASE